MSFSDIISGLIGLYKLQQAKLAGQYAPWMGMEPEQIKQSAGEPFLKQMSKEFGWKFPEIVGTPPRPTQAPQVDPAVAMLMGMGGGTSEGGQVTLPGQWTTQRQGGMVLPPIMKPENLLRQKYDPTALAEYGSGLQLTPGEKEKSELANRQRYDLEAFKQRLIEQRQKELEKIKAGLKTDKEKYTVGEIKEFKVGDETIYRKYIGEGKWEDQPELGGKSAKQKAEDTFIDIGTKLRLDPKSVSPQAKAWHAAYKDAKSIGAEAYGAARYNIMLDMPVSAYDVNTGSVGFVTRREIDAHPGRYVGGELATKIRSKKAVFEEIEQASSTAKKALNNLDRDFDPTQRAEFAYLLNSKDPGAVSTFLKTSVGKSMTSKQKEYITAVINLRESAFALRGITGMGQGSDMLRHAIEMAVLGAHTYDKETGNMALNKFDKQVEILKSGIPGLGGVTGGPKEVPIAKTPRKASEMSDSELLQELRK